MECKSDQCCTARVWLRRRLSSCVLYVDIRQLWIIVCALSKLVLERGFPWLREELHFQQWPHILFLSRCHQRDVKWSTKEASDWLFIVKTVLFMWLVLLYNTAASYFVLFSLCFSAYDLRTPRSSEPTPPVYSSISVSTCSVLCELLWIVVFNG